MNISNVVCVYRLTSLSHSGTVEKPGLESWDPEAGKSGCSNKKGAGGYSPVKVKQPLPYLLLM